MSAEMLAQPSNRTDAPQTHRVTHLGCTWSFRVAPGFPAHTIDRARSTEPQVFHARACEDVADGRLEVAMPPLLPEDIAALTPQEATAWFHLVTAMLRAPVTRTAPPEWSDALLVQLATTLRDRKDLLPLPRGL